MATIIKPQKPQDNQQAQPGSTAAQPSYIGMGGQPQQNQQSTAPRFTNVQQFLGANSGAGQKLAGNILQKKTGFENEIGSGREEAEKVKNEAEQQVGKIKTSGEQAAEAIKGVSGGQQYINPDNTVSQDFTKLYTGDAGQTDYQNRANTALTNTQTGLQNLSQFGQKIGTETGRTSLLGETMGSRGQYGRGLGLLDQIFLQKGGGQQLEGAARDIRSKLPGESQQVSDLQKGLFDADTGALSTLGKQASTTQDLLKNTLTGEQNNFETAQQNEATQLSADRMKQQELMKSFLSSGYTGLDADQQKMVNDSLKASGLSAGQRLYGVNNPTDFFKYGQSQVTANDVVDPQELARYKALSTLSGMSPDSLKYNSAGQFGGGNAVSIDDRLKELIANGQKDYNSGLQQTAFTGDTGGTNYPGGQYNMATNPFAKQGYSYADLQKVSDMMPKLNNYQHDINSAIQPLIDAGFINPNMNIDLQASAARQIIDSVPKLEEFKKQQGYYNLLGGNSMTGYSDNVYKGKDLPGLTNTGSFKSNKG